MNVALKFKKSPLATHAFCGIARLTVGRIISAMASMDGGSATHGSHLFSLNMRWSWLIMINHNHPAEMWNDEMPENHVISFH